MLQNFDFVTSNKSKYPSIIIITDKKTDIKLISIVEYKGDYAIINSNDKIKKKILLPYQKLIILSKFDPWFYDDYKDLYQEIIISFVLSSNLIAE